MRKQVEGINKKIEQEDQKIKRTYLQKKKRLSTPDGIK